MQWGVAELIDGLGAPGPGYLRLLHRVWPLSNCHLGLASTSFGRVVSNP